MLIRRAKLADVPLITQCVNKAYQYYMARMGTPPGPMIENYVKVVGEHLVYVAQRKEKLIGVVVLKENIEPVLLDNLAVDPSHQGQGIGLKLLAFAQASAIAKGNKAIQLYTNEAMHENVEFYKNRSFTISHRIEENGYKRVYMIKQLLVIDNGDRH